MPLGLNWLLATMSRERRAALVMGLAAGFICPVRADPPEEENGAIRSIVRTTPSDVLTELDKLVKADVAKLEKAPTKDTSQPAGAVSSEKPVVMSPYIVRDMKDVQPVGRVPSFSILRLWEKGTLFDPAGKSGLPFIKVRPYTAYAPQGIMNKRPTNGVELTATWSW